MHRSFNEARELVVLDAAEGEVTPLIITGTNEGGSIQAAKYASLYPGKLYSTVGVHPHDAKTCTPENCKESGKISKKTIVWLPLVNADLIIIEISCLVIYSLDVLKHR